MKMKYHYSFWRPTTAIREGETDGNPRTVPDGGWESFVFTPPYPSYPGNHATAAGAARAVLDHVYGRDGHVITLTSQLVPDVVLHYTLWGQITDDIDDARIYGGVQYRFDQDAGARLGRQVGEVHFSRTCSVLCLGDRLHGPWRREGQGRSSTTGRERTRRENDAAATPNESSMVATHGGAAAP